MNIFSIKKCGKITENDDIAIFIQGLSTDHAKQVMDTLVMATGDSAVASFVGLDTGTGEPLDPSYGHWVLTPEQLKAKFDNLRAAHYAKSPK